MYNSIASFNEKITSIVGDISQSIGKTINIFFESTENIDYPAVVVNYMAIGEYSYQSQEHFNDVNISVMTSFANKDATKTAVLIMDGILNGLGLTSQNVHQYVIVKKYDYFKNKTLPSFISNMRVKLHDGMGWEKISNEVEDNKIRHYHMFFRVMYRKDV